MKIFHLQARGVGKKYLRDAGPLQQLRNLLTGWEGEEPFWALRPLTLDIQRGEAVGVIGRNGSGKSTLLQMLMGTLTPTVGAVQAHGKVAGLLELGAGFSPDFTGRENAELNAASLGLTKTQIAQRMPLIQAFAGIGDYFERPVREYSSGMYARLAFSVAIHVDADILIVDEILAVGDADFQHKCHKWMRQFHHAGGTLVFVSQDALEVATICPRSIWLNKGEVKADGHSTEVASLYQRHLMGQYHDDDLEASIAGSRLDDEMGTFETPMHFITGRFISTAPQHGEGGARVIGLEWSDPNDPTRETFDGGTEIELKITCRAEKTIERPIIGFIFRDSDGHNLFGDNTYLSTAENPPKLSAGEIVSAVFRFQFPYLPAGTYRLAPSILEGTQDDHSHLHWLEDAQIISVTESPVKFGRFGVPSVRNSMSPLKD